MGIAEKVIHMFNMQNKLNENILKEYGQDVMTKEKLSMAIIDEIGELTHELKGSWCWWKKTQKPVNQKRVLEELVDVYHFVMTWEMKYNSNINHEFNSNKVLDSLFYYATDIILFNEKKLNRESISSKISCIVSEENKYDALLELTKMLGFTFDNVYLEYLNKNKENYERLASGY